MTSKYQPLVSVITPAYNTEKYIAECIESVLAQTYSNWQYTIVNNRSTDKTLEIAQHYAKMDKRILIHNNENFLNMLQNWNHALRQISPESKYCKVVHADDWLFPECIERMVDVSEANPSVGIVGSYVLEEDHVSNDALPYPSTVISGRKICSQRFLGMPYLFGSPTSTLIRSDLIRSRDNFYNELNFHADTEACFDILRDTDFGFIHQVLTFTRRHNETNTTFARRMNTYLLSDLITFKKYGKEYLNNHEYEKCLKKRIKKYYRFLGWSVFKKKGKDFWDYHRTGLRELGYPISSVKLIKASLIHLYNRTLDAIKIP